MSEDKYIGMDVHQASIVCAVHNPTGKCVARSIIETTAETVRDFLRGLSGTLHSTFEEGIQAHWLYELARPLVAQVIVCNPRRNHLLKEGSKSDKADASKLAELLRAGLVMPVYHDAPGVGPLKELAHAYDQLTRDRVRVMSRLKAIYRARAIACGWTTPYSHAHRNEQRRLSTRRGASRATTAGPADARLERAVQPPSQSSALRISMFQVVAPRRSNMGINPTRN